MCTQEGVKPPQTSPADTSGNHVCRFQPQSTLRERASGLLMLRETGERRVNTKHHKSGGKVVFIPTPVTKLWLKSRGMDLRTSCLCLFNFILFAGKFEFVFFPPELCSRANVTFPQKFFFFKYSNLCCFHSPFRLCYIRVL